ncbi:MAG: glycosyltransferase family 1 protein, partial [Thermodesulfobacteriota bacterium]
EYMALNKPVVATRDLRECYRYKGILIANDKKEFIEKIEKGLMIKDNPEYIKLLDEQAKENTWEARAIMIDGYISKYK